MKKFIDFIIYAVIIIFLVAFIISFFDIIAQNNFPNPQYHSWNMLVKLIER